MKRELKLGLGIAVALPVCVLGWMGRPFNPEREFGLAARALPSPNGYDTYANADHAFAGGFGPPYVSQALDYAADKNAPEDPASYPLAAKVAYVARFPRGYELFDQALKQGCVYPLALEPASDGDPDIPDYLRDLAKAVTVQSQVFALQGQHEAAVERGLDIWQMGVDSAAGAPVVVALSGAYAEGFARRAVDGEIAFLTGAEAARAARRLASIGAKRVHYCDILKDERASTLMGVRRHLEQAVYDARREPEMEAEIKAQMEHGGGVSPEYGKAPALHGPMFNRQARKTARTLAQGFEGLLKDATTPWPSRQTAPPAGTPPSAAALMGKIQGSRFHFERSDAMLQLTTARLALHAFRKDTGAYPDSLQELVPKYLNAAPTDPFAGGPLRYRRDGLRYKLWSVGPDAKDDGATPAENAQAQRPTGRYLVTSDANGDIVANVNR